MPSLKQEAKEGWDARLPLRGTTFFYQFKLSHYATHGRSKFFHEEPFYSEPYFKMEVYRKNANAQHKALYRHSQSHPNTFYVAPEFDVHTSDNRFYDSLFLSKSVSKNSRIIPLRECKPFNDNEQHFITFQRGNPTAWCHSEASQIPNSYRGEDIEKLYRSTQDEWKSVNEEFALKLLEKAKGLTTGRFGFTALPSLNNSSSELFSEQHTADILLEAANIFARSLGVVMVLVGEKSSHAN